MQCRYTNENIFQGDLDEQIKKILQELKLHCNKNWPDRVGLKQVNLRSDWEMKYSKSLRNQKIDCQQQEQYEEVLGLVF
ncbi:unnamed protein product [Paramecium sonneborni]|uniref:Uncharacterized protein n=1 Tax=Paramecium sonneborni TaxID=65129 RepID=A0A8S1RLT9_9CILI|nr:unnamed protein product [Paramecium sonneborni]